MSNKKLVLVTGITGNQGGSVAQALLANGHRVRGLTRNSDSPTAQMLKNQGIELIVGDFNHQASLNQAAQGVDAIFTMTTPFEAGVEAEVAQGKAIVEAARSAGVKHLVYSSVGGANQNSGVPHFDSKYEVEKYLQSSGVNYTIIAPAYFMDNLMLPWTLPGLQQGKLAQAMPNNRKLQQISVRDIGAFAAAIIERGEAVYGQRFDIAGDELTNEELVSILSEVSGKSIGYESFPPNALRSQSEDLALMFEWFESTGYSADIEMLRRDFPEVQWHDFRSWANQQNWTVLEQN